MSDKPSNEQFYFDTLTKIAKAYVSPEKLRKSAELRCGLDYLEALEMAYENMQAEAAAAIKGKLPRRLKGRSDRNP